MRRFAGCGGALALLAATAAVASADEHVWLPLGRAARLSCTSAPPGWQRPDFDDRAWAEQTIAFDRHDSAPPAVAGETADSRAGNRAPADGARTSAPPADGARASAPPAEGARASAPPAEGARASAPPADAGVPSCVGPRFVRWHFSAEPSALAGSRLLTLRVRYTHGFAAYLNGVEIARRRLDPAAPADALATDVHGLELEAFTVRADDLLRPGDNLLAIEVHPHTAGRATMLEATLLGDDAPRLLRGPYLLGIRETEVTVVVDSDVPTVARLRWGTSPRYGATLADALGTHHVLHLSKLKPGTVYHYRLALAEPDVAARATKSPATARDPSSPSDGVAAAGAAVDSGDIVFHTPPDAGRPLRFAVYGDVRSGHEIHAALNRSLAEEQPDLALLTGDLVDRGTDEGEWESFFDLAGPLLRQLCIFPAVGNHEYAKQGHGLAAFMDFFRWPVAAADEPSWYSFDVAGAHFVALDSDQYKSPRQLGWFEHDLREARRRRVRAIFVYAHEGPASSGLHGDNPICVRDYVPIMQRYRVSMFFGGHDHDYERGRTGTLDYVVTGGGGAELRAARCGVPGKRACPARCAIFVNDHNYVMVELLPSLFRVCPKRVDGSPIEACIQYPLRP